jgi:hypothetical protein
MASVVDETLARTNPPEQGPAGRTDSANLSEISPYKVFLVLLVMWWVLVTGTVFLVFSPAILVFSFGYFL